MSLKLTWATRTATESPKVSYVDNTAALPTQIVENILALQRIPVTIFFGRN